MAPPTATAVPLTLPFGRPRNRLPTRRASAPGRPLLPSLTPASRPTMMIRSPRPRSRLSAAPLPPRDTRRWPRCHWQRPMMKKTAMTSWITADVTWRSWMMMTMIW